MNWDAIAAIGEIAGAVAVVATLFYLAVQVRQSAKVNKIQTFDSIFHGLTSHTNEMFSARNAGLLVKGFKGFENLSPEEKLRFDSLLANLFNYAETSFRAARDGFLGEDTVKNWSWYLRSKFLAYSGVREWWEKSAGQYPSDFRDWIDGLVSEAMLQGDCFGIHSDDS